MATFTSSQVLSGRVPANIQPAGSVQSVYGAYDLTAATADGDIYELVKVPAGATVIGGYVMAEDLDTGTETLDIDIGWAANGVDAADPDGFGNLGVWTGDAVAGIKPEVGNFFPLGGVLFSAGPKTFAAETTIQAEGNAAPNAGGTGYIWIKVDYVIL